MTDTSTGPISIPPQSRFWQAEPPPAQRTQAPTRTSPRKPSPPKPSAGLYYYGCVLTVIAVIAGIIGATGGGTEGAFIIAVPLGIVGPIMFVIATYRAMSSIDYLARERFRDQNG